jgi:hypothetical protein
VLKRCGYSLTELKQAGFSDRACHLSAKAMCGRIDDVPNFDERRFHRAPKMPDSFTPRIRFFTDQDQKMSKGLVARDRLVAAGRRISMMNAAKRGTMDVSSLVKAAAAANQARKSEAALAEQDAEKAMKEHEMRAHANAVKQVTTSIPHPKEVAI